MAMHSTNIISQHERAQRGDGAAGRQVLGQNQAHRAPKFRAAGGSRGLQ